MLAPVHNKHLGRTLKSAVARFRGNVVPCAV